MGNQADSAATLGQSRSEASVVINGTRLSDQEAMTIRVALASMNFDCGDDEHGKRMEALYRANASRVLQLMERA